MLFSMAFSPQLVAPLFAQHCNGPARAFATVRGRCATFGMLRKDKKYGKAMSYLICQILVLKVPFLKVQMKSKGENSLACHSYT